ncbi:MAG: HPP family protein [Candidatus Acidiferrales bacterium]
MKRRADLIWALAEGSLMLAMAAISWATRQPLIFASLGPTAYELVEQPQLRSARTYNIIVGHLAGLGSGFLSIYLFNAWNSPAVSSAGVLTTNRLWVVAVAAALTTVVTLMLRAAQPAALATTLLVALGLMQTRRDAIAIIAGVIIMAAIGVPLRRLRLKILEMRSMATTPTPG